MLQLQQGHGFGLYLLFVEPMFLNKIESYFNYGIFFYNRMCIAIAFDYAYALLVFCYYSLFK
jgi:hypothetical protein